MTMYTTDSIRAMRDTLQDMYQGTTDAQRQAGRTWYERALAVCAALGDRHGIDTVNVIYATSALSPQQRWEQNVKLISSLCATGSAATFHKFVRKARRCLNGELDVLNPDTGPKTYFFARSICGDLDAVCIDRWILRAVGHVNPWTSRHQYASIATAITAAAELVGESPRDFQAIIWVYLRDGDNASDAPF